MTDLHQKKNEKNTSAVGPIVAGITGIVAGGMTVAAAVVMSDKNNQQKVKDTFNGAKDKVGEYIDAVKSQPVVEKSEKKLNEVVGEIKQKIDDKV